MTLPLDLALSYAAGGIPVFPCRAAETHDEDTGEIYGAKTPLTPNGLRGATSTERIIRVWWERNPDAMVGIPTGSKAGFFVLDVDNKPGGSNGFAWLEEMEAEHGPLPTTKRVKTPNGGLHVFFYYVPGTRNRGSLGAGVDVRSEGGYVIAAGSRMADGRTYEWADDTSEIADAPPWLLELLLPRPAPERPADYQPGRHANDAYVNRAIDAELSDLASAPAGNRNNRLNDAAFAIGQFVGAGALSRADAEAELTAIASQWPNLPKSRGTIRSGLDAGIAKPRDIPAPQHDNDNTRLVDITRMIENGLRKARAEKGENGNGSGELPSVYAPNGINEDYAPQGIKAATEPDAEICDSASSGENDTEKHIEETDKEPDTTSPADTPPTETPLTATPFQWLDPANLPRREFAFGTHYIRKYVSVTVAPGGLGKTANSILESLAMASGKALAGTKPPDRLRVWMFNAEDPRDELERRIMAAAIHYRLKPADITEHLFLDTGREQELVVAIDDRKAGVRVQQPIVEAVVEQIEANKIDVMIVDPFVSTHGVNENDNGAVDKVAKLWAQIADHTNCAIDIVHHLRKVADREATVEDARGAVALIGAARSVRVLNRMSEEQANKAGVGVDDRFGYFSITYGKSNLTPLSHRLDWRRLESVPLGNGRGLTKPQDHAPVVTEWRWPTKEEIAEAIPDDVRRSVVVRLANQSCRESPQSGDWAGYVVADAMGLELETGKAMTPEKRRVKAALDSWIESGVLAVVSEPDPKHIDRKVKFIRPTQGQDREAA